MEESPFDVFIEDKHRIVIVILQQIIKLGTFTAGQWHPDNFFVTVELSFPNFEETIATT